MGVEVERGAKLFTDRDSAGCQGFLAFPPSTRIRLQAKGNKELFQSLVTHGHYPLHCLAFYVTVSLLLVGCLTSQQHASVSQGRICSDKFTCCHTEIEVADQTFHLPQPQYTDTGPTSPGTDPITPGAWQGSHWNTNFEVTDLTQPRKDLGASGI